MAFGVGAERGRRRRGRFSFLRIRLAAQLAWSAAPERSEVGGDVDDRLIAPGWLWPSDALALRKIASALKRHLKGVRLKTTNLGVRSSNLFGRAS